MKCEKPKTATCDECGAVVDEWAEYTYTGGVNILCLSCDVRIAEADRYQRVLEGTNEPDVQNYTKPVTTKRAKT